MTYDWTIGEPVPEYDPLSCDCCQGKDAPRHSPLPWRVGHEEYGYKRPIIADKDWKPIAFFHSEADAEFIERAVNMHERLQYLVGRSLPLLLILADSKDNGTVACQTARKVVAEIRDFLEGRTNA